MMPTYDSICDTCGKSHVYYQPVSNYLDTPDCCGVKTRKVILSAPFSQPDIPGYESPVSGKWIEGRRARQYDLESNGCRPWEGREVEMREARKSKELEVKAQEKEIEKSVGQAWSQISQESRDVLGSL